MASVALVVLDTLRKESFDRHFQWLPGLRFERAWSSSGWTVPAHGSLFTGLPPSEAGVYAKVESLDVPTPVLAERLQEAGYRTRAFSANAYISPSFDFDRGFDTFDTNWRGRRREEDVFAWGDFISNTSDMGLRRYPLALYECIRQEVDTWKSVKIGLMMKARDLNLGKFSDDGAVEALEFVRSTTFADDEFLFLNLMEAHSPYKPPPEYRTVDVHESPGIDATVGNGPVEKAAEIEQAYEDSVRYLSDMYEQIFSELVDSFDYVVTLSDHGECFGTDGIWAHNHGINPTLTHIPLCIYNGSDVYRTEDAVVGITDVHRTISSIGGATSHGKRGQDLLDDPSATHQLVERFGLRRSEIETFRDQDMPPDELESWDQTLRGIALDDGVYGWETRSGFETTGTPEDPEAIRCQLAELVEGLDVREVDMNAQRELSDSVMQQLERLGYA